MLFCMVKLDDFLNIRVLRFIQIALSLKIIFLRAICMELVLTKLYSILGKRLFDVKLENSLLRI